MKTTKSNLHMEFCRAEKRLDIKLHKTFFCKKDREKHPEKIPVLPVEFTTSNGHFGERI